MERPTREELAKPVHVTANVTALWDGTSYELTKGQTVLNGMVYHWKQAHPDVEFIVGEVKEKTKSAKEIINPLEENDRGESFAGLKRRTKGA